MQYNLDPVSEFFEAMEDAKEYGETALIDPLFEAGELMDEEDIDMWMEDKFIDDHLEWKDIY